jgi:hypothetical protein
MTPDDVRNEHLKLIANWLNALATGIFTVGAFIPAGQMIFNILPAGADLSLVVGTGLVCIGVGFAIHLAAHMFLGGLR